MNTNKEESQKGLMDDHKPSVENFNILFDSLNIRKGVSNDEFRQKFENIEGLARALKLELTKGLDVSDEKDINERKSTYGINCTKEAEETSFMDFVWECLEDPTLKILLVASFVSLIIGIYQEGFSTGWIEGTAIFFAVFIVVSITAFNNYSKEQQFLALNKSASKKMYPF